ncbi:6,7-dimethyl-8-ribityllumazine synthase [Paucibacter sp. APW11]|uniref:6,7-dimethyl-8-ribityllumazine synthase n=1 Tax=Roseateles aquae TaxID=3077235 RepID=A0ABU3PI44_9BURK|nr:6,7-dimethyl-8-ribityllumazine synthase [Paucibacter sp. APW11]MDT9002037.1 6,7-dimethyl-8-ribityllumazine synthase [Paucibacter sp. APW11]
MNQTVLSPVASATSPSGKAGSGRIAVICASWHADIVGQSREALLAELKAEGWPPDRVDVYEVPGAFEIPLHALKLARAGRHRAIIGCGLVVDGGIYRHDFVAHAVIDGLMRVQLDTEVPVFSAVLTPQQFHEHEEHRQFFHAHFVKKGREVAQACLRTLRSLEALSVPDWAADAAEAA